MTDIISDGVLVEFFGIPELVPDLHFQLMSQKCLEEFNNFPRLEIGVDQLMAIRHSHRVTVLDDTRRVMITIRGIDAKTRVDYFESTIRLASRIVDAVKEYLPPCDVKCRFDP